MNLEKITEFITVQSVDLNMKATNKSEAIVELTKLLEKSGKLDNIDKTLEALKEREKLGSTGIGKGVAIPHAKTEFAKDLVIAFGVSKQGVNFNSVDDEKVKVQVAEKVEMTFARTAIASVVSKKNKETK